MSYHDIQDPYICCDAYTTNNCYPNFDEGGWASDVPNWLNMNYYGFWPACITCAQHVPTCPTGFSPQWPTSCIVDTSITYVDTAGTFTLDDGRYTEGTNGYIGNSACYQ